MAVQRVFPFAEEEAVLRRPDDLVEVLEDEEELRQLVEGVEAVAQLGPVTMPRKHAVAEAVDRGNRQLREIARVAHLARRSGQAVAHLEGSFLSEGTQRELLGLRLL